MSSIFIDIGREVAVALSGAACLGFWQRVTKRNKPRFSRDTGFSARQTLNRAKKIFGLAGATGGHLSHPWQIRGDDISEVVTAI